MRRWPLHVHLASMNCFAFSLSMILVLSGRPSGSFLLGYETLTVVGEAADGDEAIELAFRLAPHVIIMDVKMPRKSGVEATQRIKRALPEIHIIGVSTQHDTFLKASMKAAGFSTFVTKDRAHTLPDVIATIYWPLHHAGLPI